VLVAVRAEHHSDWSSESRWGLFEGNGLGSGLLGSRQDPGDLRQCGVHAVVLRKGAPKVAICAQQCSRVLQPAQALQGEASDHESIVASRVEAEGRSSGGGGPLEVAGSEVLLGQLELSDGLLLGTGVRLVGWEQQGEEHRSDRDDGIDDNRPGAQDASPLLNLSPILYEYVELVHL